ncbi:hypothetical protein SK069_10900 [Patulibacter brassicae]|uniref:Uncharacterized protein n=1 Tax=Patulibacter brassicae TaxID=1705717 RepID=A0ABU4VMI6_9ACTN|nr:hypothetical protein [Patulibacter brassicae]MDX8152103.1 hypothetical protein [Patulibacter brassicae]
MVRTIRRVLATTIAILAFASFGAPANASAACSIGGSGVTYNRNGVAAVFKNLQPLRGMNCPSARYVMNKWLRRAYARSRSSRLPSRFYDGYVTWYCGKTSRLRWRCNEYTTSTAFTFTAYRP